MPRSKGKGLAGSPRKRARRTASDCPRRRALPTATLGWLAATAVFRRSLPRHATRRGLGVLLLGNSRTRTTRAAEDIADVLDLDLHRIDLRSVVSKYIGETEKNLTRIFAEAERAGWALFFDEADALFGRRTEVKDAHDRYANPDVAYLLGRIESFAGVVVLAANRRENLDPAFLRRLDAVCRVPAPKPRRRRPRD